MITAIVGSRNMTDYSKVKIILDKYEDITCIISGGANGADRLADYYAQEKKIPFEAILPDWKKYGKSAGAIRNKQIVDKSERVIAFWDGVSKGTKITIDMAKKSNKIVDVILCQKDCNK